MTKKPISVEFGISNTDDTKTYYVSTRYDREFRSWYANIHFEGEAGKTAEEAVARLAESVADFLKAAKETA